MQSLIQWLEAYRHRTAIAAAALSGIPLLMMFSSGLIVMVTLRRGLRDGLLVSGGATLFLVLFYLVVRGPVTVAIANAIVLWAPAIGLAMLLLRARSLSLCLQLLTVLSLALVGIFWLLVSDPVAWWRPILHEVYIPELQKAVTNLDAERLVGFMAPLMTGAMAAGWMLMTAAGLLTGRWLQSLLDQPGAFRREFVLHRQGKVVGVLAALVFVAAGVAGFTILQNLVLVLIVAFLLQGLALAHWAVSRRGMSVAWLVAAYVVLVMGMPWSLVLLASAGFIDNWLDLRKAEGQGESPD